MCHRSLPSTLLLLGALAAPGAAWAQDSDGDGAPDLVDVAPCDAAVAGHLFAPAETQAGSMLFEDQWPSQGDLDFNDLVLGYHYLYRLDALGRVASVRMRFEALALGGVFDNGFAFTLPVPRSAVSQVVLTEGTVSRALTPSPSDANLTVVVYDDLRALFGGRAGQINSLPDAPRAAGGVFEVEVRLSTPQVMAAGQAPHDVFVFRTQQPGLEIHRPEYAGSSRMDATLFGTGDDGSAPGRRFVDRSGLPFALWFPDAIPYPQEGTPISALFPDIAAFAASGGAQAGDFYTRPQPSAAYADAAGLGALLPAPLTPHPADTTCVVSRPPLALDVGPDATLDEGQTFASAGLAADPSGATLSLTVDYGDGLGAGATAIRTDGTFDLTAAYADDGAYVVQGVLTSPDGRSATDTATVTVRNLPPVVDIGGDARLEQAGARWQRSGSASDPGADALTATVDYGDGATGTLTIAADGTFGLDHVYASAGTYPVTVNVTDDDGGSAQASLTLEVPTCGGGQVDCDLDGVCESAADAPSGASLPAPMPGAASSTTTFCQVPPASQPFATQVEHAWAGGNIMQAPVVTQLTDDNGDGRIDAADQPDILVTSFSGQQYWRPGTLRALTIQNGSLVELWSRYGAVHAGSEIAAADLDNDGHVEIVTCTPGQGTYGGGASGVIAYRDDGTPYWSNYEYSQVRCSFGGPAIGDLNQDGYPEVLIGATVLDGRTGAVQRVHLPPETAAGYPSLSDLDGDGQLDIVTGAYAARADGTVVYDMRAPLSLGGFAHHGVADLDGDGAPEVVVVDGSTHTLYVLSRGATGQFSVVRGPVDINDGVTTNSVCGSGEYGGGPPTIADLDGDGVPDVGVAGAVRYAALSGRRLMDPTVTSTATVLWSQPTEDCSSAATGSSVFDFNGDGRAEIMYADELLLHVYDGATGAVLYETCNTSGTIAEYPVVADIDNDGEAEVLVPSAGYYRLCTLGTTQERNSGLRVFGSTDGSWPATRSIWNQHSYHYTNVNDDGSIPRVEASNWTQPGLNNYRQQRLPGREFPAADLQVRLQADCSSGGLGLRAVVYNEGSAAVPPGATVSFRASAAPSASFGSALTTSTIAPGGHEVVTWRWAPGQPTPSATTQLFASVTAGADCDPGNNASAPVYAACGHCGACGVTCTNPGGATACVSGACVPTCNPGAGDCDGDAANGCEADLFADVTSCGACGNTCAAGPNATASCVAGQCGLACAAGYADCDGDPSNGCEADLTSPTSCGGCGNVCNVAFGTGACVAGACAVATCDATHDDCDADPSNGCETSLATVGNCGACGNACAAPGGLAVCTGGVCGVSGCNPGFGDCDADPSNGCEAALDAAPNCGACGNTCALANASGACVDGGCAVAACLPGFADCDGDPSNGCEAAHGTLGSCVAPPAFDLASAPRTATEGAPYVAQVQLVSAQGPLTASVDFGVGQGAQSVAVAADGTLTLSHTYADDGTFTVNLTATDANGLAGAASFTLSVANAAPVVDAGMDATLTEGGRLTQLVLVTDPGADAVTATVDYGDGSGAQALTLASDGTGSLDHVYVQDGAYTVTVAAQDDGGAQGADTLQVVVQNAPPALNLSGTTQMSEGGAFQASGQATDVGAADTLVATIDYGVGPQPLALALDGTFSVTQPFDDDGSFTVTVRVTDDAGVSAQASLPLVVTNVPPSVQLNSPGAVTAGAPFAAQGTFSDPSPVDTHTATVDFGDGTGPRAVTLGAGTFGLSHTFAAAGAYAAQLELTDDDGGRATVPFAVTVTALLCANGTADCDGDASNGCEVDLTTVLDCGGCGNACSTTNGTPACQAGLCEMACDAGYADCDGDPSNGCELALGTDANCGACGDVCLPGFACGGGTCNPVCGAGYADCDADPTNGCEADLASVTSCGACGTVCALANATPACAAGACAVAACDTGYADCDADPTNGCEASLAAPTSCGACGVTCGSGEMCQAGACVAGPTVAMPEVCDGQDNDLDGQTDEGLTVACNSACGAGVVTCTNGQWTGCSAPQPTAEVCDGLDNDCDGTPDDGIYPACGTPTCGPSNGAAPQVAITSPTRDAVIANLVTVQGTVGDSDLDTWALEVRPAGANQWQILATGTTPVASAALGDLDPSLLKNGHAELRLRAVDCQGRSNEATVAVQFDGMNKVGITELEFEDLKVHLGGLPIQVVRSYDSRERFASGDFGFGWSLDVNVAGELTTNYPAGLGWTLNCPIFFGSPSANNVLAPRIQVRLNDVEVYEFRPTISTSSIRTVTGGCQANIGFQSVGPWPATLVDLDGTAVTYQLSTGYVVRDTDFSIYDVGRVELRLPDGRRFRISSANGVEWVRDAHGNSLTINATSIVHSAGASVTMARDGAGRITRVTAPSGTSLLYAYDSRGDLTQVTDRGGGVSSFEYSSEHHLLQHRDASGRLAARFERDAAGRVTRLADGNQSSTAVSYDAAVNQMQVVGPDGVAFSADFDSNGRPAALVTPEGTFSTVMDARGNLSMVQGPDGSTSAVQYDSRGNVTRAEAPDGRAETYAYTYAGDRMTSKVVTDAAGRTTRFEFDGNGSPTRIVRPGGVEDRRQYDARGLMTQQTIDDGVAPASTGFAYDSAGRLTSKTLPNGQIETRAYDLDGRLTQTSQTLTLSATAPPITAAETMLRDANGHVTRRVMADGRSADYSFDGAGRIVALTDLQGRAHQYRYDPAGRVTGTGPAPGSNAVERYYDYGADLRPQRVRRSDGRASDLLYSAAGALTQVSNLSEWMDLEGGALDIRVTYRGDGLIDEVVAGNGTTRMSYDSAGRITRATLAAGGVRQMAYDAAGRITEVTEPSGAVNTFLYDSSGRLTQQGLPGGASVHRSFDALGRVTSMVDPNGATEAFAYDAAGRMTTHTDKGGNARSFTYNEQGWLLSYTNGNGATTTFEYDVHGRRTLERRPSSAETLYAYDSQGRLTRQTNPNGTYVDLAYGPRGELIQRQLSTGETYTMTYDSQGRLSTQSWSLGTEAYTYDAQGRLASVSDPLGRILQLGYDAEGRRTMLQTVNQSVAYQYTAGLLTAVADDAGQYQLARDSQGRLTRVDYPNGATREVAYDLRNRVTRIRHLDRTGAPMAVLDYGYDARDVVVRLDRTTPSGRDTSTYHYDARGLMTSESHRSGVTTSTTTYAYDAEGRRTSVTTGTLGTASSTYDSDDRMLTFGSQTLGYDASGNVINWSDPTRGGVFGWDADGRLTSLARAGLAETYSYDVNGVRRRRVSNGLVTDYLYEPDRALPRIVEAAEGTQVDTLTWGLQPLARSSAGVWEFIHGDLSDSTVQYSDALGRAAGAVDWSSFGRLESGTAGLVGFKGEPTDSTGLTYMRARYYAPSLGGFLSRDTMDVRGGRAFTYPRYSFVGYSPVTYSDPSGHVLSLPSLSVASASRGLLIGGRAGLIAVRLLPRAMYLIGLATSFRLGFQAVGDHTLSFGTLIQASRILALQYGVEAARDKVIAAREGADNDAGEDAEAALAEIRLAIDYALLDSGGWQPSRLSQDHFAVMDHYLEAYLRAQAAQTTTSVLATCAVAPGYDAVKGVDQTIGTNMIWAAGQVAGIPDMTSHSPTTSQANYTSMIAIWFGCRDFAVGEGP